MSEPRTKAGRDLLKRLPVRVYGGFDGLDTTTAILAIEAEAAHPEPVGLRERLLNELADTEYVIDGPTFDAIFGAVQRALAPSPTPAAEGLDAAWKAAEAALPEGMSLVRLDYAPGLREKYGEEPYRAHAEWWADHDLRREDADGPTPAAALQALAARLATTATPEGSE